MAYSHYDRLTALDLSFLQYESVDPNVHMHVGAVALFDGAPLLGLDGGIDIDRIRRGIDSALGESPRFRQKLATIPLVESPVWIDDEHFNLQYHVRHTALPQPGSMEKLKALAGRIFSQKLDRGKPMWEFWFVEGLEGGRMALITKAHHAMVDGISGFDLLARIMRMDPDPTIHPRRPWIPRPAPSGASLLRDEAWRRATFPAQLAASGVRSFTSPLASLRQLRSLGEGTSAVFEALTANLRPASSTPLNAEIGPFRRFATARFELDAVKEVKRRLGGTVNDVVLACVAGAIGRFLKERGVAVSDLTFKAMIPVSVRRAEERGTESNRVVSVFAELPVAEPDPRRRLAWVTEETRRLKGSRQARGVELFEEFADRVWQGIFVSLARMMAMQHSFNVVVTNVPGPRTPAWFLGAPLQEIYPLVPLFVNQCLGIALFSYAGGLHWGLHADWDAVPDLEDIVGWLESDFEILRKAAAAV